MEPLSPWPTICNSLAGLLTSGEYSDLTITSQGKEFRVHRSILCSQSPFFRAALKHGWKVIKMPSDLPGLSHTGS